MANPKHVALVRKGAKAIAAWRQAHPRARLDLSKADLSGADLSWGDLSTADLNGVDLNGANLSGAIFIEADLLAASLNGANLSRAFLVGANLSWAAFANANLDEAYFALTSLSHIDLSQAGGLGTAQHLAPSSVGVDTLMASFRGAGDRLPELTTFFLGAGVPEELLREVPRIVAEVKYYTCFISYGQHDLEFAKKLTEDLRAKGVPCWLWETDKTVGEPTRQEIERKLEEYEKMVVLCSIHSLLGNGIRREIDRQLAKDREKLVPISLEEGWKHDNYKADCLGTDLKPFLIDRNYADFANKPYDEALAELLKGLRRP